jgi:hypothetical protein
MLAASAWRLRAGHFHGVHSAKYQSLYGGAAARHGGLLPRRQLARRGDVALMEDAPPRGALTPALASTAAPPQARAAASIEPATFSHRARMPEFAAMDSAAAAERASPSSEGVEDPFGSLRQDAEARSAERRWVAAAPGMVRSARAHGLRTFGEGTAQHEEDAKWAAQRRRAQAERGESAALETSQEPSHVRVPLLPVNYLRRHSYGEAEANGDVARDGHTPRATDDLARLQHVVQTNTLRQVRTAEWFRCRRCGLTREAVPDALLREGGVHDPRGPSERCAGCRGTSWQWLADYAHRTTHAAPARGAARRRARSARSKHQQQLQAT